MAHFLLMPNATSAEAVDFSVALAKYLEKKEQSPCFLASDAPTVRDVPLAELSELPSDTAVISLGGDGTLLHNVHRLNRFELSFFGINFGHLGFLTGGSPENAFEMIDKILEGQYHITKRMLLEGRIVHADQTEQTFLSINEAVVTRGTYSRALKMTISVNDDRMEPFSADGILISTPTGSTAYNLAAGGPVILPTANVFAVNPICSQALTNHTMIVPGDDEATIQVRMPQEQESDARSQLISDSYDKFNLQDGDLLFFRKAKYTLNTIELKHQGFMKTLHGKLTRFL